MDECNAVRTSEGSGSNRRKKADGNTPVARSAILQGGAAAQSLRPEIQPTLVVDLIYG